MKLYIVLQAFQLKPFLHGVSLGLGPSFHKAISVLRLSYVYVKNASSSVADLRSGQCYHCRCTCVHLCFIKYRSCQYLATDVAGEDCIESVSPCRPLILTLKNQIIDIIWQYIGKYTTQNMLKNTRCFSYYYI